MIVGAALAWAVQRELPNNYRDVEADTRVGRRTLAILAGRHGTTWIYAGLMLTPFALLVPIERALPQQQ